MQNDGDVDEEENYNTQPPKNLEHGLEGGRGTQSERGLNTNLTNTTKNQ